MKRREFLKVVGGAAVTPSLLSTYNVSAAEVVEKVAGLPRRVLGRTGQKVSIVGFPGLCLVHPEWATEAACQKAVRGAYEKGVNYFDVAPAYGNGTCETRMGLGLQGMDRSQYFLACKTKKRDKDGARQELENSLKLLKTDHFDLYQMHHLVKVDEVKQALGPGGALETYLKAKEEGKIKYIGFSAHTTKAALEAMKGFRFDTVMFPISFTEYFNRDFGRAVMDLANEQGAAVLAIKAMMRGAWPKDVKQTRQWWYRPVEDPLELRLAWNFVLSLKGVVAGFTPAWMDLLDKAIEVAKAYQPATEADVAELKRIAATCDTIFQREEALASADRHGEMPYPYHPYDDPGGEHA